MLSFRIAYLLGIKVRGLLLNSSTQSVFWWAHLSSSYLPMLDVPQFSKTSAQRYNITAHQHPSRPSHSAATSSAWTDSD